MLYGTQSYVKYFIHSQQLVNLAKIVELESYDILRSVNVIINKKLITKNDKKFENWGGGTSR